MKNLSFHEISKSNQTAKFGVINNILAYISLFNIVLGLFGNTTCFFIFRFNSDLKKLSSLVYLSFCAVLDTIALFIWNFDSFSFVMFNFVIEDLNLFTCKFFVYFQYVCLQSSSILLSMASIDRLVTIKSRPGSFITRLPFSTTKSAYTWSFAIIFILGALNIHIAIFNGYLDPPQLKNFTANATNITLLKLDYFQNPDIHCYSYSPTLPFEFLPTWDIVHFALYNIFPFCLMLVSNIQIIITLMMSKKNVRLSSKSAKALNRKKII